MKFSSQLPSLPGILFIALLAGAATALSTLPFFQHLSFSPLIVGILIGILFANTLGRYLPEQWRSGLKFCSKRILRIGIIFFGFRLTLNDVAQVGLSAVALDAIIVCSTLGLGILVGKWLKMDKETTLLTSSGSAICGAAAVLGAETTLKSEAYKTAVAVSTQWFSSAHSLCSSIPSCIATDSSPFHLAKWDSTPVPQSTKWHTLWVLPMPWEKTWPKWL